MALKVAIQMDPLENSKPLNLASFWISLEAQRRGHALYHYLPRDLSLNGKTVTARARPLKLSRETPPHYEFGDWETIDLGGFDIVLMRQDPPFDMTYLTATYILEHIMDRVLVTNNPTEVRNAPEKLFVTNFPDLAPPTLISANRDDIHAFKKEWGEIIIKPLYRHGGAGIFYIDKAGTNMNAILEMFFERSTEPLVIQKFLPEIKDGDKRIILFDGEFAGGFIRFSVQGEIRSNVGFGGKYEKITMTKRDHEICERLSTELTKRGLIFTSIDVIGEFLTEINVTSPGGFYYINKLYGLTIERDLWDIYEDKLQKLRQK